MNKKTRRLLQAVGLLLIVGSVVGSFFFDRNQMTLRLVISMPICVLGVILQIFAMEYGRNPKLRYVIAVKRERRDAVGPNWLSVIEKTNGVKIISAGPHTARIEIGMADTDRVRQELGDFIIEMDVMHLATSSDVKVV